MTNPIFIFFQNWIDSDFDDNLNLDFEFAKPLPPKKLSPFTFNKKPSISTTKKAEKIPVKNLHLQQWSDRHAPKNSTQLAVNPKKVRFFNNSEPDTFIEQKQKRVHMYYIQLLDIFLFAAT